MSRILRCIVVPIRGRNFGGFFHSIYTYTEYDTSNYHGLYARVTEDGPLIAAYRSGKHIITGPSDIEELHRTNNTFLNQLTELGVIEAGTQSGFSVVNVVLIAELGNDVNLNALLIALGLENTEYEPEQFPGLVYRPQGVSAVTLVIHWFRDRQRRTASIARC